MPETTRYAQTPKYVNYFIDEMKNPDMVNLVDKFEETVTELYAKADRDGNEYTTDRDTLQSWIDEDETSERVEYSVKLLMTENFLQERLQESLEGFMLKHMSDLFDGEESTDADEQAENAKSLNRIVDFVKQTASENKHKEGLTNFGKSFYDLFIEATPEDKEERRALLTAFGNNIHLFK